MHMGAGLEGLDRFVHRREAKAVDGLMQEGEVLRATLDAGLGAARGILAATDRRLLFVSKGLVRTHVRQWEYDGVDSITVARGKDDATVTLEGNAPVTFTGARKDAAEAFHAAARLCVADRTFRLARVVGDAQEVDLDTGSLEERLRRLERMKTRRILTEAEYTVNRRRILEAAGLPTDLQLGTRARAEDRETVTGRRRGQGSPGLRTR